MATDAIRAVGNLLVRGLDYGVQIGGAPIAAVPGTVGAAKAFTPSAPLNLSTATEGAIQAFTQDVDGAAQAFLTRNAPTAAQAARFPLYYKIRDFLSKQLFVAVASLKNAGIFGELAKVGGKNASSQAIMNTVRVMGIRGGLLGAGLVAMVGFGTLMVIKGFNDAWWRHEEIGRHHPVGRAHSQPYQLGRMANYGLMAAGIAATFVNSVAGVGLFALGAGIAWFLGNVYEPIRFGINPLTYPGANPEGNILDRAPFRGLFNAINGGPTPLG